MKVRTLLVAEAELLDAAQWYESRQLGLGARFVDEYQSAVLRIELSPTSFPTLETTRSRREFGTAD